MKLNPDLLLREIHLLNKNVEKNLKKKGYIPPKKNKDGSIRIGGFTIIKDDLGFFSVLDQNKHAIASGINLPHAAAIFANNLALGNWTNREILDIDRKFGHYTFDTELTKYYYNKNLKAHDYGQAEILNEKFKVASFRKKLYKDKIIEGFNKLMKIA